MQIDKQDTRQLKQFAIMMSWAFPAVFSLLLPWLFNYGWQYWPLVISVCFLFLWLVKAPWIYFPYKMWMSIAGVIGWVNTRVILAICFYLLIAPIGILMKFLGKLDYQDKTPSNKTTNYQLNPTKANKKDLENPF